MYRAMLAAAMMYLALAAGAGVQAAELKIGIEAEISSIDPHFHNYIPNQVMSDHLYDGLTTLNDQQEPAPALAESWTVISPTEWRFTLRPNVKFSDGSPLTVEDVIFSLKRPATIVNSPSSFAPYVSAISDVKALDDHTIAITTSEPSPLLTLDLRRVMIVSKAAAEHATTEDFNSGKAEVGTGPYTLVKWTRGDRVVLKANPYYWGPKPEWDTVTMRFIKSPAARLAALLSGDVDIIENVLPADATKLRADPKIRVVSVPTSFLYFFQPYVGPKLQPYIKTADGQPMKVNPLADRDVRLAMAMALDKKTIIDRLLDGEAMPNGQILVKGSPAYSDKLPDTVYDPEKARALLAKAGYPNGFQLTMHCGNDRVLYGDKMCLAYAQMLTRIGIKTDVETMPHVVWVQKVNKRDFSLAMRYWDFPSGEPSEMFRVNYHTPDPEKKMGLQNRGEYSNPKMDQEIESALSTMDDKERTDKFRALTEELVGEGAAIPFINPNRIWAMRKGLDIEPDVDSLTKVGTIHAVN
jgi:peptide/nickel transport system substrate-binding protein